MSVGTLPEQKLWRPCPPPSTRPHASMLPPLPSHSLDVLSTAPRCGDYDPLTFYTLPTIDDKPQHTPVLLQVAAHHNYATFDDTDLAIQSAQEFELWTAGGTPRIWNDLVVPERMRFQYGGIRKVSRKSTGKSSSRSQSQANRVKARKIEVIASPNTRAPSKERSPKAVSDRAMQVSPEEYAIHRELSQQLDINVRRHGCAWARQEETRVPGQGRTVMEVDDYMRTPPFDCSGLDAAYTSVPPPPLIGHGTIDTAADMQLGSSPSRLPCFSFDQLLSDHRSKGRGGGGGGNNPPSTTGSQGISLYATAGPEPFVPYYHDFSYEHPCVRTNE